MVGALYALFVLWMAVNVFDQLTAPTLGWMPNRAPLLLALDLWTLAAAAAIAVVARDPFGWSNRRRLVLGATAFALMLARLVMGTGGYLPPCGGMPKPMLFAFAPVLLFFVGLTVIGAAGLVIGALFALLVGAPVVLFNQIFAFEKSLAVFRYQANGLAGYIARAVWWLRNERRPAAAPDDGKGARFATRPELIALHNGANGKPFRMAFGHWEQERIGLSLHTDKHVLVMASTRSGKGVSLIIPHLLRYPGSAFVLDPKGENARATGRRRAAFGKVHYLDPFGISGKPRSRFNPLARFTPESMEADSKALAAAFFLSAEREQDHWTAAGQQLLAALILYVYCSPNYGRHQKDLRYVRQALLGSVMECLEDMAGLDHGDGLLRDLAMSFINTPEKERGSIISTAQRQTEILDNPYVTACLAAEGEGQEVDFSAWHAGTMTVYLCLAAPKFPVFNRWLRLVLTSALDEMTERLDPPALPICFMLDELATLGHFRPVENAVGLAAGYGIQLVTVFQDVAQMKDLYRARWSSFVGNAGVRAVFNLDDHESADYWSKFVGTHLVESRSTQQDIYGYSKGDSISETMRPLLSPDHIMLDFAAGRMLVLAQGAHPFTTRRVPYWEDQELAGQWDDPRPQAKPRVVAATPSPSPSSPAPGAPSIPPQRPVSGGHAAPAYVIKGAQTGGFRGRQWGRP